MNKVIELIQQRSYGAYRLCPPLEEPQLSQAMTMLPNDLLEILKVSNGILELMTHPKANDGKPFVIGSILYPFDEIVSQTKVFNELYTVEGIVFAGNGAGGYFVIRPDGNIYLYEYVGEEGEYYAEDIIGYISKHYG
jgi:hypothetical protein